MAEDQPSIWIGLVEVRPLPGSETLKQAKGAFVNVLTWASEEIEFEEKVKTLCRDLDLELIGIEDLEPLAKRLLGGRLEDEIMDAAGELELEPDGIRYTSFHTWRTEDA